MIADQSFKSVEKQTIATTKFLNDLLQSLSFDHIGEKIALKYKKQPTEINNVINEILNVSSKYKVSNRIISVFEQSLIKHLRQN